MSLLYHYCSHNTFLKIINSKQLLMNDISKCNDEQELKIIKNFVINSLNIFYSKNKNLEYIYEFKICFLHTIIEWFDENKQIYKYFISCLSLNKDSELMWSRYGDNDKGICIGFDKEVLTDFKASANNKVIKVEYIDSQSKSNFF